MIIKKIPKNLSYQFVEQKWDKDGGLTQWTKRFSVKVKTENFYITYIDNLSGYLNLTSNTDKIVLAYLCTKAEYDTGRAFVDPQERIDACKEFDISIQQFSNSISKLKSLSLITGKNGFYMINPAIFWKGNSKTRSSLLTDNKLAVEFNFELDDDSIKPNLSFDKEDEQGRIQ